MATPVGRFLSVNVGGVGEFGRPARSAIWKSPAVGRIAARGVNLAGDDQADRKAHGGPDKVVYAYAVEDARWWAQEIDRSSSVSVWLPAFARAVGAPPPPRVTEAEALAAAGEDAVYYGTKLRGASNAKARRTLGFAPRRLEWLRA